MLCCGQSVDDIANRFKVSTKTIQRDLDWWEKRLGQDTEDLKRDPKKAAMDVGITAKRLMKLAEDAYVEHVACSNGAFKARFLQVSGNMLVYRHKVLADAGYLPKVGHEKESAPKVTINFAARYGPEASIFSEDPTARRRVTDAFLAIVKTGGLADKDVLGLPLSRSNVESTPIEGETTNDVGDDLGEATAGEIAGPEPTGVADGVAGADGE